MKKILALALAVSFYSTAHAQSSAYETHSLDTKLCNELYMDSFSFGRERIYAYGHVWTKNRSGDWITYLCSDKTILKATEESIQKGVLAEKLRQEEIEQQKIQRLKASGFY